jgi:hypothetical protein
MHKLIMVIVCSLLTSCAWTGQTYHGVEFSTPWRGCGKAANPTECAFQLGRMLDLTKHAYEKKTGLQIFAADLALLNKIEIYSFPLFCDSESGRCHGLLIPEEYGQHRIALRRTSCIATTSLAHEAIHLFAGETIGHSDSLHSRTDFWGEDGVEARAVAAGRAEGMCGSPPGTIIYLGDSNE